MTNEPRRLDEMDQKTGNGDFTSSVLDVRLAGEFIQRHRAGAANIPLEELDSRIHELPPRDQALLVFDLDDSRAQRAAGLLRARERDQVEVASGGAWLASGPVETGPSNSRLWKPHGLLVEAIRIARDRWGQLVGRTAIDLACGTGRDAVYLATQGFHVQAIDNLPDALERCSSLAVRNGVNVRTVCRDLERRGLSEEQSYDLVSCFNYLHRPLMKEIAKIVRPGGMVAYETFTTRQRELFNKPRRNEHLLLPSELPGYFAEWEIVLHREGLAGERRWVASLVAIKPE